MLFGLTTQNACNILPFLAKRRAMNITWVQALFINPYICNINLGLLNQLHMQKKKLVKSRFYNIMNCNTCKEEEIKLQKLC